MDGLPNKTAKLAFVSTFLKLYKGQHYECIRITDDNTLDWVYDLLEGHRNWEAKSAGMEWIGVHQGHFCLVSDNGSSGGGRKKHMDISYKKCLTHPTARSLLFKACRDAIQYQATNARNAIFNGTEQVYCQRPPCRRPLVNDGTTHLDHILRFVDIFDEWLAGRDPATIATTSIGVRRIFTPEAKTAAAEWVQFHADRAHFRALCVPCNLTRPRKDKVFA
jgi:hypothetical protein